MRVPREDTYRPDDDFAMPATPEMRLWSAVLALAVMDARSSVASLRVDVAAWLNTPDFERVCELAVQSPESIRQGIQRILGHQPQRTVKQQAKLDRQQKVIALHDQGHSLQNIANETGLSKAGVNKIVRTNRGTNVLTTY